MTAMSDEEVIQIFPSSDVPNLKFPSRTPVCWFFSNFNSRRSSLSDTQPGTALQTCRESAV